MINTTKTQLLSSPPPLSRARFFFFVFVNIPKTKLYRKTHTKFVYFFYREYSPQDTHTHTHTLLPITGLRFGLNRLPIILKIIFSSSGFRVQFNCNCNFYLFFFLVLVLFQPKALSENVYKQCLLLIINEVIQVLEYIYIRTSIP